MNERVLVVDDEPLILSTIDRALGKSGYIVKTTSSADEFLGALSSGTFDLLIMDLHLGGVRPDVLFEKAKGLAPGAQVLVISGSVDGLSGKCFLQKPFRVDELRQKVRALLDKRGCRP